MTSTREHRDHDPRVDELRQRLKSLGYLDAGVDRFVLAPAYAGRGPAAIALLASLRIGAIAAALLGPAAAMGLGGRLTSLVTGPRDAIVLALYVGALLGAAVAAIAFVASLFVAWLAGRPGAALARRARAVSLVAGSIVAMLCLGYLTLWWQTATAGLGWSAPVWTGFALAVAAAISLLLGHAVTVTALAVIAAGAGPVTNVRGVPGASWRVSLAAGAVAFAGAAALLLLSAPAESGTPPPSSLTVVPSGVRVRVFAIDGFDPGLFEELSGAGQLPSLTHALGGARAVLRLDESTDSGGTVADPARTWTTIATGQPAAAHGVYGLETRRLAGVQGTVAVNERSPLSETIRAATDLLRLTRPGVASGVERREKTFWEVASDAGLRTAVVNWWATWPAASDTGVILTDRATLRLETGGDLDGELAPASVYADVLKPAWPELKRRASELGKAAVNDSGARQKEVASLLLRSAELDAMQLIFADQFGKDVDLLAVYLPGLDIAQHSLLGSDGRLGSASSVAARLEALKGYYAALDRLLTRFVRSDSENEMVFVITSPGRVSGTPHGLIGVRGPNARVNAVASGGATDVGPTILHTLGVPLSHELTGKPLLELFSEQFVSRYPVRHVASYGRPSVKAAGRHGRPLDQEMIDRLRSLGYVR
jgi:hypothetical protein